MNTQNLDTLMERSTSTPRTTESMMAQTILHEMFVEHGSAMVAALKVVTRSGHHAGCEWYSQLPQCTCGVARVAQLLTQLDQEAHVRSEVD